MDGHAGRRDWAVPVCETIAEHDRLSTARDGARMNRAGELETVVLYRQALNTTMAPYLK